MHIRDLRAEDRPQWDALWAGYLEFYKSTLDDAVTETTFARLLDPAEPMFALVAEHDASLVGFTHCVIHRGTWAIGNFCYLEDLFVAPRARGAGAGRALVEAVYARADALGCSRIYWHTHETNTAAQALYDKIARRSGFIVYRRS